MVFTKNNLLRHLLLALLLGSAFVFIRFSQQLTAHAEPEGTPPVYLPLILNNHDATLGHPLFGVQMYSDTRSTSQYHSSLVNSQATWVRAQVNWRSIEPEDVSPAQYDWGAADQALGAAYYQHGSYQMIATIHAAPDWAAPGNRAPLYAGRLPDFAEFVGALVERFDGDGVADAPGSPVVSYWEFYNEPDANDDYFEAGWGNYGQQYASLLATAYAAVKAANPNAQVVFGGIAHDWFEDQNGPFVREFLDDVLAAGGGNYFDVMNFHAYPHFAFNWATQGPGLLEKTDAIRDILTTYGVGDKPMMITEAGWHSNNPPNSPSSPEIQARYVVELFTQSLAADVDVMIWWMLHDPGGFYSENGLVTDDATPQPKLAYYAYGTAVDELSTAHFDYRLSNAQTGATDMEAYRFIDNVHERIVYVAWLNPVDTTTVKVLQLWGTQATVRDIIYGNTQTVVDTNGDGRVSIYVTGQPVYVEIDQ
jgi:hypothetical protein